MSQPMKSFRSHRKIFTDFLETFTELSRDVSRHLVSCPGLLPSTQRSTPWNLALAALHELGILEADGGPAQHEEALTVPTKAVMVKVWTPEVGLIQEPFGNIPFPDTVFEPATIALSAEQTEAVERLSTQLHQVHRGSSQAFLNNEDEVDFMITCDHTHPDIAPYIDRLSSCYNHPAVSSDPPFLLIEGKHAGGNLLEECQPHRESTNHTKVSHTPFTMPRVSQRKILIEWFLERIERDKTNLAYRFH
ncbi:hypothetical protein L211DRAFT_866451 [Terfezia boudieri ATCC MYA-4762]|uniref:Uncharacterized protein n=1 Tax=Terfezia boudieri ATCC MYA-4762 TaxID=1051890 RepID=A0A3N4M0W9_9PEZI|nr:hypothetical protein L211DRAFT_866451 [Terfezia boudieri ATCC MYA-4762]